jgi:hypothetical protein
MFFLGASRFVPQPNNKFHGYRMDGGNPKDCCRKFGDPAGILKIAAGSSEILRES